MGADFVLVHCRIDHDKETAVAKLTEMTDEFIDSVLVDWADDDIEGYTLRQRAMDALDEVYRCCSTRHRDGAALQIGNADYVFAGGDSWGDWPSELCEHILICDLLGITQKDNT